MFLVNRGPEPEVLAKMVSYKCMLLKLFINFKRVNDTTLNFEAVILKEHLLRHQS